MIDEAGNNLGVLDTFQAVQVAQERGLDLVEIAPKVQPPVCKIIDLGKYKYQQAKKEQKHKTKQKEVEVKGIRIGLSTSTHDLEHKAKQAEDFLKEGNKVKIEIKLIGREKAHQDLAKEKLNEFLKIISIAHSVEEEPKRSPFGLTMTIIKT